MSAADNFHQKPYDSGTLTKLQIFELYVQSWLPVFLSRVNPRFTAVHFFDFFCGPGVDSEGTYGSPLRILNQLRIYKASNLAGWKKVSKNVHFSDLSQTKIEQLKGNISSRNFELADIHITTEQLSFEDALARKESVLMDPKAAKLLIIDQFGVDAITDSIFRKLISYPRTDFIFFVSSSTLHRFRDHPAIKQKIERPNDSYHVHRAAYDYYKKLIPSGAEVFLGQFSIRKNANIYGLIFGSQHPLGIHKFLDVAWKNDRIAGEANFDVDREHIKSDEILLDFEEFKPKKIQSFESALRDAFLAKRFRNESEIIRFCIEAGMTAKHAAPIIAELKNEQILTCDFRVPNVSNFKHPRNISY